MNRLVIFVLAISGGMCLHRGAESGSHDVILIGLLLLCFAMGLVINSRAATVVMRNHTRAMWKAGWIYYLFRRLG